MLHLLHKLLELLLQITGATMTGKQIGYIRVSSIDQNSDRQLDNVVLDKTFTEKQSGATVNERPVLLDCIDFIREGDTLHIHSIDRLARNLSDLLDLVKQITGKGVAVKFHKECLEFSANDDDMFKRLMLQVIGACAEFERNMIKARQKEGIAKAKEKGVKFGAAVKLDDDQIKQIKRAIDAGASVTTIAKNYGVSRQTIYRMIK